MAGVDFADERAGEFGQAGAGGIQACGGVQEVCFDAGFRGYGHVEVAGDGLGDGSGERVSGTPGAQFAPGQLAAVLVGRRLVDPPVNAVAYELTTTGRELGRALAPLAIWGARHFLTEERPAQEVFRAEWALVFLADSLEPAQLRDLAVDYEFHIDDGVARLHIADGRAEIISGTGEITPDAVLRSDAATVGAIAGGRLTVSDAVSRGHIRAEGDPEALRTLLTLLERQVRSLVAPAGYDGME